jgi:hypothetical protein
MPARRGASHFGDPQAPPHLHHRLLLPPGRGRAAGVSSRLRRAWPNGRPSAHHQAHPPAARSAPTRDQQRPTGCVGRRRRRCRRARAGLGPFLTRARRCRSPPPPPTDLGRSRSPIPRPSTPTTTVRSRSRSRSHPTLPPPSRAPSAPPPPPAARGPPRLLPLRYRRALTLAHSRPLCSLSSASPPRERCSFVRVVLSCRVVSCVPRVVCRAGKRRLAGQRCRRARAHTRCNRRHRRRGVSSVRRRATPPPHQELPTSRRARSPRRPNRPGPHRRPRPPGPPPLRSQQQTCSRRREPPRLSSGCRRLGLRV